VHVTRPTEAAARKEGAATTNAVLAALGKVKNVATENISLRPSDSWSSSDWSSDL
jgi:hypothetical protein